MGLEVFWSHFAELKLKEIYEYYQLNASNRVAIKIIDGIVKQTLNLNETPEIGQKEIHLNEEVREFPYLIYQNYKIIYYIFNKFVLKNAPTTLIL